MSSLKDDENKQLMEAFFIDADEKLEELEDLLVRIEKDPGDDDTINRVFRAMHTLKGNAGFFGLKKVESLAHSAENLFSDIRDHKYQVNQNIIDMLLASTDGLKTPLRLLQKQKKKKRPKPKLARPPMSTQRLSESTSPSLMS